jgi:hypothetical protein
MGSFQQTWIKSRLFRIILIAAILYAAIRLAAQITLSVERMLPGQSETQIIPNDLQDYLKAAMRLSQHEDLYPPTDRMEYYQYPPVFALIIRPLLWLPPAINFVLNFILRLAGYCLLYIGWGRIFRRTKLRNIMEIWAWLLPIWMVFSAFWSDLSYMNIYIITAAFATLFIDSVLREDLGQSILWLTILLQTKPHWAFAMAVPALLGRWKFFFKLLLAGLLINLGIFAGFLLVVGRPYGWAQISAYPRFLASLSSAFPWRTQANSFIGYNHSLMQIVLFLFGKSATARLAALLLKTLMLIPTAWVALHQILHPVKRRGDEVPTLALGLTFMLYLAVFIWMDMVWEASLSCAVFAFLWASCQLSRISRWVMGAVFLLYALVDLWQFISYAALGDQIIDSNGYILTDYSAFFPIVMLVILVFYAFLIRFLWPDGGFSLRLKENVPGDSSGSLPG